MSRADVLLDTENILHGAGPSTPRNLWRGLVDWIQAGSDDAVRQLRSYGKVTDSGVRLLDSYVTATFGFDVVEAPIGRTRPAFSGSGRARHVRVVLVRVPRGDDEAENALIDDLEAAVGDRTVAPTVVVGSGDRRTLDFAHQVETDVGRSEAGPAVWAVVPHSHRDTVYRNWERDYPAVDVARVVLASDLVSRGIATRQRMPYTPAPRPEPSPDPQLPLIDEPADSETARRLDAIDATSWTELARAPFGSLDWDIAIRNDVWLRAALAERIPRDADASHFVLLASGRADRALCRQVVGTSALAALLDESSPADADWIARRLRRPASRYGYLRGALETWLLRNSPQF